MPNPIYLLRERERERREGEKRLKERQKRKLNIKRYMKYIKGSKQKKKSRRRSRSSDKMMSKGDKRPKPRLLLIEGEKKGKNELKRRNNEISNRATI